MIYLMIVFFSLFASIILFVLIIITYCYIVIIIVLKCFPRVYQTSTEVNNYHFKSIKKNYTVGNIYVDLMPVFVYLCIHTIALCFMLLFFIVIIIVLQNYHCVYRKKFTKHCNTASKTTM